MNMKITVFCGEETHVLETEKDGTLLDLLAEYGYAVQAPCGGKGRCGKCRVTLLSPDGREKEVLACQTAVSDGLSVRVNETTGGGLTEHGALLWEGGAEGFGAAVDIGTTTVAASLVKLSDGSVVESRAVLNPQHICGADVISRISACAEGKLSLQEKLIRETVSDLIGGFCKACGEEKLHIVTICGNTTMLHLFCGVDPTPIGVFPFTPAFTEQREYPGEELGISAECVFVLPSASGYIGSDVVCGVLSQKIGESGKKLLVDLGTNGELALYNGEELVCASTAAGPALEGANIECGMGGVSGAVCSATVQNGELSFETVEKASPSGICGSGLVDLIAQLVSCEAVDETGCFDPDIEAPFCEDRLTEERFALTNSVWLSQKDVRQFQLAKSAVSAGILTLCEDADVSPSEVDELCIAGGLGFYLKEESALGTGLIPREFAGKIRAVGNSGLAGTILCLLEENRKKAAKIAENMRICELNKCPGFSDLFIENMSF